MQINFFQKNIHFEWNQEEAIRHWMVSTIQKEKPDLSIGEISVIFCSDDYLLDINRRYLDHDYYTDIITFPFEENPLSGELYISIDRIKENASDLGIDFKLELARVIIHGVLHLCGYSDGTDDEQSKMRSLEDFYLAALPDLGDAKYK